MAKTAPQLERDIRTRLLKCKVSARGLWHEMRYVIETESDRPGELHRHGAPISASQLAHEAGCPAKKVTPLLEQLKTVGLVEVTSTGVIYSPLLARIVNKHERHAERQNRYRARRGESRDAGCDAPCDAGGDALTPSPPASPASLSLPTTLSLTPPSPPPTPPIAGCAGDSRREVGEGAKPRKKPSGPFAELVAYFCEKWRERYDRPYPFRAVDGKKMKELIAAVGGSVEDAKAVIDRYLADDDLFMHGHSLTLLTGASFLPRYLTERRDAYDPAVQAKRVAQMMKAGNT